MVVRSGAAPGSSSCVSARGRGAWERLLAKRMVTASDVVLTAKIDGVVWPVTRLSLCGFELPADFPCSRTRAIRSGRLLCRIDQWQSVVEFSASLGPPGFHVGEVRAYFEPMSASAIDRLLDALIRIEKVRLVNFVGPRLPRFRVRLAFSAATGAAIYFVYLRDWHQHFLGILPFW